MEIRDEWLPGVVAVGKGVGRAQWILVQEYFVCYKVDTCIIHLSKPTECTTPRMNLKTNFGLWVMMMMCQCGFILGNKCTILVGDVGNGGGSAFVGQR